MLLRFPNSTRCAFPLNSSGWFGRAWFKNAKNESYLYGNDGGMGDPPEKQFLSLESQVCLASLLLSPASPSTLDSIADLALNGRSLPLTKQHQYFSHRHITNSSSGNQYSIGVRLANWPAVQKHFTEWAGKCVYITLTALVMPTKCSPGLACN